MVSIRSVLICALFIYCVNREVSSTTENPTTDKVTTSPKTEKVTTTPNLHGSTDSTGSATPSANTPSTIQQTTNPPLYPYGDPRNCKGTTLESLPKYGWDNLVYNASKGEIFHFNYSKCQKTNDNYQYLIPDQIIAAEVAQNPKDELTVEIFGNWNEYTPILAPSLKHDSSEPTVEQQIMGSFSPDYQKVKKDMIEKKSFVVRVQLKKPVYQVGFASRKFSLASEFSEEIVNISSYLIDSSVEVSNYFTDKLVAKYGTHFPLRVKSGGLLVVEYTVKDTYANVQDDAERLKEVAKAMFNQHFNKSQKIEAKLEEELKKFEKASTNITFVIGGKMDTKSATIKKWVESIEKNQKPIEYYQFPLDLLITSARFSKIPGPLLKRVENAIKEAIRRYYQFNIHYGCTNPTASNFAFEANFDDNTCNVTKANYAFGGVYQKCNASAELCQGLQQKNSVTGDYTCPENFLEVPLRFKIVHKNTKVTSCTWKCTGWLFSDCTKVCTPEDAPVYVEYKAYWCVQMKPSEKNIGVAFGGIYTSKSNNPNTGDKTCPAHYDTLKVDKDINVCVGKKTEESANAVPFGGFYSCVTGNPLAAYVAEYWPKKCPEGYSRHVANIDAQCQISYCAAPETKTKHTYPHLVVPASRPEPAVDPYHTVTLVIVDENNGRIYYRKTTHDAWNEAHSLKELKEAGLEGLYNATILNNKQTQAPAPTPSINFSVNTADYEDENDTMTSSPSADRAKSQKDGKSDGMSGGTVAAITILTIAAVVAVVGVGAFMYKKRTNLERSNSRTQLNNSVEAGNQSVSYDSQGHSS